MHRAFLSAATASIRILPAFPTCRRGFDRPDGARSVYTVDISIYLYLDIYTTPMLIDLRTILPSTFIYIQSVQAARNLASRHLAHFSCSTRPHQVPSKRILSPNLAACLRQRSLLHYHSRLRGLDCLHTHHIPSILPCACTYILPLSARGRVISTQSVVAGYCLLLCLLA